MRFDHYSKLSNIDIEGKFKNVLSYPFEQKNYAKFVSLTQKAM